MRTIMLKLHRATKIVGKLHRERSARLWFKMCRNPRRCRSNLGTIFQKVPYSCVFEGKCKQQQLLFLSLCILLMIMIQKCATLVLLALVHTPAVIANNLMQVDTFELSDLLSGQRLHDLSTTLSTTGLLAIRSSHFRFDALKLVCRRQQNLLAYKGDATTSVLLQDGVTTRTTWATATVGTTPLPLGTEAEELDALRDQVALASNAFVKALDRLLSIADKDDVDTPLLRTDRGVQYSSIESIVKASVHLEHFHLYEKGDTTSNEETLEWHTDAGLFLAFVPACNCRGGEEHDSSLWVDNSPVVFPPNTIAIMLGTGAENWLQTHLTLRATRHAVKMNAGDLRAWYGMSKSFKS